jgi:hypothetical protein
VAAVAGLGALLIVLMARSVIGHIPLYDELLHVLSARGLLEHGAPAIADGVYSRARLFTQIVATSIAAFGDTLVAARLPSLAFAALLLALLGAWLARRVGGVAAMGAVLALCLVPATLQLAVFVRFYTLHALVVLAMSLLVFDALAPDRPPRWRVLLSLGAVLLLPLAWHLQSSTAVAVAALLAAATAVLAFDHWTLVVAVLRRHPILCAATAAVLIAVGLFALSWLGFIDALREVPLWASGSANKKHYYVIQFSRAMPLLWPLLPFAVLGAFFVDRRLALFCVVFFAVVFVVHSLAAAKQVRYLFYVLPIASMLWGLGLAQALRAARTAGGRLAILAAVAAALVLSAEGQRMAKLLAGRIPMVEALPYTVEPDWVPVMETVRPLAAGADRVITSNAMKSLYYLGRYDYELNASIVAETDSGMDFGTDLRTGRQAIGSAAAVTQVLRQPGTTLVVVEDEVLNRATGVSSSAAEALLPFCSKVELPAAGLSVWQCRPEGR